MATGEACLLCGAALVNGAVGGAIGKAMCLETSLAHGDLAVHLRTSLTCGNLAVPLRTNLTRGDLVVHLGDQPCM